MSITKYSCMLLIGTVVVLLYTITFVLNTYPKNTSDIAAADILVKDLMFSEFGVRVNIFGCMFKMDSLLNTVNMAALIGVVATSYLVIIYSIRKIRTHITQSGLQCDKVKQFNRQLTIILNIQACVPVLEVIIVLSMVIKGILGGEVGQMNTIYAMLFLMWPPVLNPVVTIALIRPYREVFTCCYQSRTSVENSLGKVPQSTVVQRFVSIR
ncbi:serpentine type 7TM GPCR chemoreceptor srd domain-containing protein [Ditylenchus destructor]|uniref:Serpentine type 7TM GPCR chemoreceptor srd domain-containing protein n=1 Tax=Ditylenchus destructor TaxID=166010 RepID=A0AAD4R2A3_9BILA|nr:serpentine type 7TM GPCR chemoreceptor srd domain-containing protein [Ditylenchus destructor]